MKHIHCNLLLILFVTFAAQLGASVLSVVPLAEALQNPALVEIDPESADYQAALQDVTNLMLNHPDDEESADFSTRLANFARYRDTRVGKLFFRALAAAPGIENLPEGADRAGLNATWPLALNASIRVRVEFRKIEDAWLVSELEVTIDGVAGSPVAGMAPYFGTGEIRELLLDLEVIDYVVGRDADDRRRPVSERKPFDYDTALTDIFEAEQSAVLTLLQTLNETITPGTSRQDRIAALKPHLTTQHEVDVLVDADADPERRDAFWTGLYAQLKGSVKAARPAAMPTRSGAIVRVSWRDDGTTRTLTCTRKAPEADDEEGSLALRGQLPTENDDEEGDSSGD